MFHRTLFSPVKKHVMAETWSNHFPYDYHFVTSSRRNFGSSSIQQYFSSLSSHSISIELQSGLWLGHCDTLQWNCWCARDRWPVAWPSFGQALAVRQCLCWSAVFSFHQTWVNLLGCPLFFFVKIVALCLHTRVLWTSELPKVLLRWRISHVPMIM